MFEGFSLSVTHATLLILAINIKLNIKLPPMITSKIIVNNLPVFIAYKILNHLLELDLNALVPSQTLLLDNCQPVKSKTYRYQNLTYYQNEK
jgi:hypothetical protein